MATARWETNRWNLYVYAADGTSHERLLDRFTSQRPQFWTPGDVGIVIVEQGRGADSQDLRLLQVSLEGDREERILLQPSDVVRGAALSPDGHYMAYEATEAGRSEVFVRPFPEVEEWRRIVSSGGGTSPHWVDRGRRLLYRGPTAIMAVDVDTQRDFVPGRPRVVMDAPPLPVGDITWTERDLAVSSDGKSMILLEDDPTDDSQEPPPKIVVVRNWFSEIRE